MSKLNSYGAFIKVTDGIRGLVHVSEFGSQENMKTKLEEGKEYDFEIVMINPEDRKVILRMVNA